MNHGILITYRYSGDEAFWAKVTSTFTRAVAADPDLAGRFTYHVQKAADGVTRIHIGRWSDEEAVRRMQSRAYFIAFATALKELAGDSMTSLRFEVASSSEAAAA
jgi:quinol monooxygenase YgiN